MAARPPASAANTEGFGALSRLGLRLDKPLKVTGRRPNNARCDWIPAMFGAETVAEAFRVWKRLAPGTARYKCQPSKSW